MKSKTNPIGLLEGSSRVIRGGCWGNLAQFLRSALRNDYGPGVRPGYMGFRLLRTADTCRSTPFTLGGEQSSCEAELRAENERLKSKFARILSILGEP